MIRDLNSIKAASDFLVGHWHAGTRCDAVPAALRPRDRAEGYAIQAVLEQKTDKPLFGWKIAATSIAGQKHIGVDGPMAGRILAERCFPSGARITLGNNLMRVAEIEFGFRMGRDLSPRTTPYSLDEVMDAVGALHPMIEIPDSRYDDFVHVGAPQLIADNACAHFLVAGVACPDTWRSLDLAAYKPIGRIAGKGEWEGLGANVLGDPRIGLTWLANELSGLGITLKAGETVTTGTCLTPLAISAGDHVTGDFGPLGSVEVLIV